MLIIENEIDVFSENIQMKLYPIEAFTFLPLYVLLNLYSCMCEGFPYVSHQLITGEDRQY